jgi:hypothetical protein
MTVVTARPGTSHTRFGVDLREGLLPAAAQAWPHGECDLAEGGRLLRESNGAASVVLEGQA